MDKVKDLKLNIDSKNYDDGVQKLLNEVKPNWTSVETKILSGGYSCITLRSYEKDNHKDSVTIRIQNLVPSLGNANKLEVKALKYLSETGCCPDLLATFGNGYCYRYIKGKPAVNFATGDVTLHDTMLRKSAHKLALIHTINIPDTDMNTPTLYLMFKNMIASSQYEPLSPDYPSKEVLLNECSVMEQFCQETRTRVGFCHGDTHPGNMVWNQENETVTFVDWELAHVGCQYNDIAHFVGITQSLWRQHLPTFAPDFDLRLLRQDCPDKFCRYYYEEWCRLQHQQMIQTEFDTFKEDIEKFKICDAFLILVIPAIIPEEKYNLANSQSGFMKKSLETYMEYKKRVLGRTDFG